MHTNDAHNLFIRFYSQNTYKFFFQIDRMQEIEIKNLCMNSVNKNTEIRDYSILKTVLTFKMVCINLFLF